MSGTPGYLLADLCTFGVGGSAASFVTVSKAEDARRIVETDRSVAEPQGLLVLGGGSNVVVSDEGFDGLVMVMRGGQVTSKPLSDGRISFTADAGIDWDELVRTTVEEGTVGVEMMSGIPGTVGGAPIQNIGAYGQQVCDSIEWVEGIDRRDGSLSKISAAECDFGFRHSRFKSDWTDRYVITSVTFALPRAADASPSPSTYRDIERYFEDHPDRSARDVVDRRIAVLHTRRTKSMVVDRTDPNARGAGSFFVNPTVPSELADSLTKEFRLAGLTPTYLEGRKSVESSGYRRIPAALLLRYAGFNPGDDWGPVKLSDKHVLAVVAKPGAKATDIWNLGWHLRGRVYDACGIELAAEPRFIGSFPEYSEPHFDRDYRYRPASNREPEWLGNNR